jgi:hypothetical protein
MSLPFIKASPVCELRNIYYAVSARNIVVLAECASGVTKKMGLGMCNHDAALINTSLH